tara:strand:- start:423 stop:1271 length:849 start_codon:yes stop_codon:yes gene_type:complete
MEKRGQSQIYIYIIILIGIGFLVFFGHSVFVKVQKTSLESSMILFQKEIEKDLAPLGYEDVLENTYSLPPQVHTVCFINSDVLEGLSMPSTGLNRFPLIMNSITGGVKRNVFLLAENGEILNTFYTPFDAPILNYYCGETLNGVLSLRLGGTEEGKKGVVSKLEAVLEAPPSGPSELTVAGTSLEVDNPTGSVISRVEFSVYDRPPGGSIVSDNYEITLFNAGGDSVDMSTVPDLTLGISIPYPNCDSVGEDSITIIGGQFHNTPLRCEDGNLVGRLVPYTP